MKGVVIYKGKYGSTKQYAEWLAAELNLPVFVADHIRIEQLKSYDYLVMGTPVYAGKLLLHSWFKKNLGAMPGKKIFLFIVSGTPPEEKQKLESYVQKTVPPEIGNNSKVYFMRGRMILKQLSFFDRLMLKIGALLAKDEKEKREMQKEFDDVKKEYLDELLIGIKKLSTMKKEEVHPV